MELRLLKPVGRLAPTPSGDLHLGNALAFAACWLSAKQAGGRVILRVEDVDRGRARPEVADGQRRDLLWMGFDWDAETPRQGVRDYAPWLDRLADHTYFCTCTRRQLKDIAGRCDCVSADHTRGAVRFRLERAAITFDDRHFGPVQSEPDAFPDPTMKRADGTYTYTLAVVADDIADGVTEVVRGSDLLDYTAVQIELWRAFGATPPTWLHAPMVVDADGQKLSKARGAIEISALRNQGWTPDRLWRTVLPWLGIHDVGSLSDAVDQFDPTGGESDEIRWISET